nr:hypothetical protein CFP56_38937 [Quercus suber]
MYQCLPRRRWEPALRRRAIPNLPRILPHHATQQYDQRDREQKTADARYCCRHHDFRRPYRHHRLYSSHCQARTTLRELRLHRIRSNIRMATFRLGLLRRPSARRVCHLSHRHDRVHVRRSSEARDPSPQSHGRHRPAQHDVRLHLPRALGLRPARHLRHPPRSLRPAPSRHPSRRHRTLRRRLRPLRPHHPARRHMRHRMLDGREPLRMGVRPRRRHPRLPPLGLRSREREARRATQRYDAQHDHPARARTDLPGEQRGLQRLQRRGRHLPHAELRHPHRRVVLYRAQEAGGREVPTRLVRRVLQRRVDR